MKINIFITILLILSIILNIIGYQSFLVFLSLVWSISSILIIYGGIKYSFKYHFLQFNLKNIIQALKSKSKNSISPFASLCISLAAKIGVGSLSGVALAIYFGGIGTIFWITLISLLVVINTYIECRLGIKYREKIGDNYLGGPSYYIKKCLGNQYLSYLYGILLIIAYSVLFLSIQTNTIIGTIGYFNLNINYAIIILFIITLLIIIKGLKGVSTINHFIVPLMIILYFGLGLYVFIKNISIIPTLCLSILKEAFNLRSIIPVFLIGMQRAIFMTESSLGTSAIAASTCDNDGDKQAMLEVLGIYIIIFFICLTTFLIIVTSNYQLVKFSNLSGIEIVIYAFKYHFGSYGGIIISLITILFAFSTIISSYFFGESNLLMFSKKKLIQVTYKVVFMLVILISCYLKTTIIWNLTDFFVAILALINMYAIIKIID